MELKTYFAQDRSGNIIPSANVAIYLTGTTTLATGLQTAGGSPLSNPFTATVDGKIQFRAPNGIYDMQVSLGDTAGAAVTVQCVDINQMLTDASKAAEDSAEALEQTQQLFDQFNTEKENLISEAELSGNDGERYIGICPSIATLRTIEPSFASQRITLREHTAGTGKGGGQFRAVMDGSTYTDDNGTIIKTTGGAVWLRINADIVNPLMFGAVGDGTTNDTTALQSAINAAVGRRGVIGTGHTYGVGKLNVTVGVKLIKSLKLRCVVASTDIVLGSLVDTGHDDLVIDGVHVDANSNVTKASILMSGMRRSVIKNCRVWGNQVHGDLYGIRVGVLSSTSVNEQNKILDNHVLMPTDPDNGLGTDAMVGISLTGIPSSTYGGLDINGGNPLWPSVLTIKDTIVRGNYIEGGTHGFAGGSVFRAQITNNQIVSSSHRNINLSGNCQRCLVANNHLLDAGSSAVNVAWGSRWMMVHNNYIQSSAADAYSTDDAAIQMYKAVDSCSIVGNLVLGSWKYSVYLGSMVTNIDVSSNSFLSGSLANIAIESDWVNTSTYPLAIYSRNYDPTAVPVAGDSGNINIGGNTYAGACCAIYMVAVNSKSLYNVNVHDEVIGSAGSRPHIVYAYDAGTLMTDGALSNISARGASSSQYYLSRGRGAFVRVKDVTSLDDAAAEFTVSGSTPSAIFGPNIYIASGTVTNFTNAQNGDVLSVRMADGVVLVHNSSVMRLKGGVNATASGGLAILTLQKRAGIWFEMSRNF